ncbi:CobN component of cobalt chelatase involved in B12 biosynthesis [Richelia intracellularis HH01]|uniref:CobN component of cobalt chelatase involved in B12 biosynthesis n=1 Tax=Richelia intracellularis HH01 TaxID=1165094 RepID=M1X257_9NOST|nr:cobaltochelatase subunit CobN [Richelia intracellularis]CCH66245.1 CobN component of cobalt chelatase involved in B12 biosynthesis [Richelia intracellularis HH01]HAE06111.1 cobaltochelatase subunit CobN [Richelia sp.]
MHRISTISGEWNPLSDGVTFMEQTPADLVLLTAADTDIQTLAAAIPKLPDDFPTLRVVNLLKLEHQTSIDVYAEEVLEFAKVIIVRLLGGYSYWSYGLEVIEEIVQRQGISLILIPGDDILDAELISHSNLPLVTINRIWSYFCEGGTDNISNALQLITDICLSTKYNPSPPHVIPRIGIYKWKRMINMEENHAPICCYLPFPSKIGVIFYRSHYLAGNTKVIDALCTALEECNLEPIPVYISSLREFDVQANLIELFQPRKKKPVSLILNTTSFSMVRLDVEAPQTNLWQKLDIPVFQVILSGSSQFQWDSQWQGLSPRDIAMNVALPEMDGRIISRAISFKALQTRNSYLETDVVTYEPVSDRIYFVANLAANWARLHSKLRSQRRIALILANYPTRNGRIGNGVGLDTPSSCVEILKALKTEGYSLEDIPSNGDDLIKLLTSGVTNDPEAKELRNVFQSVSLSKYKEYFVTLPVKIQDSIIQRWGVPDKQANFPEAFSPRPGFLDSHSSYFPISGIQLGNVFIGIQPARGYDIDPSLNYHSPDLEPTHEYLAFYYWIRECFGSDAVIHVGKHGNLEWLPGKSIALSSNCYPEIAMGALPHLYPFIVNDPGEGSQAKRRAQAVIIDHLTPPLTRAELYGDLQKLENLIDEYYEAESLDPSRLPAISNYIQQLITQQNLNLDLGITNGLEELQINHMDGYLCELKEAQIRDGLHIFGQCPQKNQLRDLIVAIARQPNQHHLGITRSLSINLGLDFDPISDDLSTILSLHSKQVLLNTYNKTCYTIGDALELLEQKVASLVENIIEIASDTKNGKGEEEKEIIFSQFSSNPPLSNSLNWISDYLLPALRQTHNEITNLIQGLDGKYVPSGPSGAPTRGRPEVLPTGKNFYSVDIRALPTETAWDIGRKAAETLIENYIQENGEYPKALGISVWGTATMRTGGDDIAEALALLGVKPVWDRTARRVIDFEILPLTILGRPRVDVTLRISGFFRDAFANLVDLFDRAVVSVSALDEPVEQNPLAAQVKQETDYWKKQGLDLSTAKQRSQYRIFGSKPGAYGAGLQGLIESKNWVNDEDLARAYINWSCYAYSNQAGEVQHFDSTGKNLSNTSSSLHSHWGKSAPEAFEHRLKNMEVVLHNQDNREHDLLDSDDYYQFQGGLTLAVRSVRGQNPQIYFGDHSLPNKPRIRLLKEEIARVYRSRVINPKWIAGVMRHGYKGAFEMAATVDYLFAYDATTKCVENFMYQGIVEAYLIDSQTFQFILQHNPYALRDIAERILEASQRGLWHDANIQTLEILRDIVHQAEAAIEGNTVV